MVLPGSATYLCLDNDSRKLRRFKNKYPSGFALIVDATKISFKDKSIDYALGISLIHHLSNAELPLFFKELARVVKHGIILLDPVEHEKSKLSKLLWKYDRGSYPRSEQDLCSAIEPWFEIETSEPYSIYHHYLFLLAKPRTTK